jgi:alpha-glucosidase
MSTSLLRFACSFALLAVVAHACATPAPARQVRRVTYTAGERSLVIEVLDDDLFHFEYAAGLTATGSTPTTPMVAKTDYAGPSQFRNDGAGQFETAAARVQVDAASLCLTLTDTARQPAAALTTLCPGELVEEEKSPTLTPNARQHVYGLGQRFITPGQPNGDWFGATLPPGSPNGNNMQDFNGGFAGHTQFPVMYALGATGENYALVYAFTSTDLPALCTAYMELVGRSLVPPKTMFGLWVSEYGHDNWAELEDKLRTLRKNRFPLDGFVLDLYWFGGGVTPSYMGALTWDTDAFPDPEQKITELCDRHGVRLMLIEESYVSDWLPDYADLGERGFIPQKTEGVEPVYLLGWWGKGGMLDWSNPAAGDYWQNTKRQPRMDMGIVGHWADLGEPELYFFRAWYHDFPERNLHRHIDIHNLYTLLWIQSIQRGYERNGVAQRPFVMTRSGTPGMQRSGGAMWSGDLASRLSSLATHFNAQLHLSFSGIDYYGTDIGGFVRKALDGDADELYTIWFANGMALDVPGRPHTDNQADLYETAPNRLGDLASNLDNVRLRYRLIPYVCSLAHRAYHFGDPVFPPLVYDYQNDSNVRSVSDQKLIGRDLLLATVSEHGQTERYVYLPAGTWFNFRTHERVKSVGEWRRGEPLYRDGLFQLPLFARAGAILSLMHVDEETLNALGQRLDGSVHDELIVRVYAGAQPTTFTLYEDDGATVAYQKGEVRTTALSQELAEGKVTVTIGAVEGTYAAAPAARDNVIELVVGAAPTTVTLNGSALPAHATRVAFESASTGWFVDESGLVLIKSGRLEVTQVKTFVVQLNP